MSRQLAYRLSRHADQRRAQMGLTMADVLNVLNNPEIDRPARDEGVRMASGTTRRADRLRVSAVYDPRTLTVITVLPWTNDQYQREDT